MLPVMKTPEAVAAMEEAAIFPVPVKVRKRGLRLASNLAMKELVPVLDEFGRLRPLST